MKTGRPGYYIPSPSTCSRDAKAAFARARTKMARILREYEGKVSFATDAWTSPNHHAFMAVTAHLEHNGEPLCFLLDIVEVAKVRTLSLFQKCTVLSWCLDSLTPASIWPRHSRRSCTSSASNIRLVVRVTKSTLTHLAPCQILSVTGDNASNNDTMTDALADALPEFQGTFARTRCFLHILNIVAKAILKQFDVKDVPDAEALVDDDVRQLAELAQELESEEATTRGEMREAEGEDIVPDDQDDASWVDEVETMTDDEQEEYERSIRPVKMVLVKVSDTHPRRAALSLLTVFFPSQIRKIAFKIVHSTTKLLPAWRDICAELGLPERLVPRDVRTRWNSTYDMAVVSIKYRKAIDRVCALRDGGLRAYELSSREWEVLGQLRDVLKVSERVTHVAPSRETFLTHTNMFIWALRPQTLVRTRDHLLHAPSVLHHHSRVPAILMSRRYYC